MDVATLLSLLLVAGLVYVPGFFHGYRRGHDDGLFEGMTDEAGKARSHALQRECAAAELRCAELQERLDLLSEDLATIEPEDFEWLLRSLPDASTRKSVQAVIDDFFSKRERREN